MAFEQFKDWRELLSLHHFYCGAYIDKLRYCYLYTSQQHNIIVKINSQRISVWFLLFCLACVHMHMLHASSLSIILPLQSSLPPSLLAHTHTHTLRGPQVHILLHTIENVHAHLQSSRGDVMTCNERYINPLNLALDSNNQGVGEGSDPTVGIGSRRRKKRSTVKRTLRNKRQEPQVQQGLSENVTLVSK